MRAPMLSIEDLTVDLPGPSGPVRALDAVSLSAHCGEVLGLVGESGGGKSMIALTLVGLLPAGAQTSGRVLFEGKDILALRGAELHAHRGSGVALCFQSPRAALCATRTIGRQLSDRLAAHASPGEPALDPLALLREVGLRDAPRVAASFPHQLSGGMAQRAMIALTLACRPRLLVADEPTTGLDVTLTGEILHLIARQARTGARGVVIISHDIAALARVCDRVVILETGRVVETGPTRGVLQAPAHPYTARLIAAVPDIDAPPPPARPGEPAPLLELRDVEVRYPGRFGRHGHHALRGVSLTLHAGETIGIVGESGSGKSTLSRAMMGLLRPASGQVLFGGTDLARLGRPALRALRANMQMVFQDPVDALNPRMTVKQILADPLRLVGLGPEARAARIEAILEDVGLSSAFAERRPSELSGGQAQRVGIARALVIDPAMVVLDEPTSALDVTVQAQILDLIRSLTARHDRAYVLVSHDLATVRALCDRVIVIDGGRICDEGPTERVFAAPRSEVTAKLLAAVPRLARSAVPPSGSRSQQEGQLDG